jgi:hypothetical protein
MRKLLLLALATLLIFGVANAQTPDYYLAFGNTDGSPVTVTLDTDIALPIWYQSPATTSDEVSFLHIPLASDTVYITARTGGVKMYPLSAWDDCSFLAPDLNQPVAGWISQSMLGFADLGGDPNPNLATLGAWLQIGSFNMHTTANTYWIDSTVVAFQEGYNPANHGLLMGLTDGVTNVFPAQTFSPLYFTPNTAPVWTLAPTSVNADAGIEVCFDLAGYDADGDPLTIDGSYGFHFTGTGTVTGHVCLVTGASETLWFVLSDGVDSDSINVDIVVSDIELEITCPPAFPGEVVDVPVKLHTAVFLTGGFEILLAWDPTGLTLQNVVPTWRINYGDEYFFVNVGDAGPGTARITWVADIPNGVPGTPAVAGSGNIFKLQFLVDATLPFGVNIPIEFIGTHYSDNTISDPSGYQLVWPLLTAGCVNVSDPDEFKGDPNLNCYLYEVADAVLVARDLIAPPSINVWGENTTNCYAPLSGTDDDDMQIAAADLNDNGVVDIADLVQFINIINGTLPTPPKVDPGATAVAVTMPNQISDNMVISVNSGLDVAGALVVINHSGVEVGSPIAAEGMEVLSSDVDGVLRVVVYSIEGNTIAAGNATLFTVPVSGEGNMSFAEVSVADSYGRLLDATASLVAPLPTAFAVNGNYPNPFNAKTMINFALPTASDVKVQIYSITGQLVESISGQYEAGNHSITWDASNVSSGVYFYKVSAGSFNQTMKMTLLK